MYYWFSTFKYIFILHDMMHTHPGSGTNKFSYTIPSRRIVSLIKIFIHLSPIIRKILRPLAAIIPLTWHDAYRSVLEPINFLTPLVKHMSCSIFFYYFYFIILHSVVLQKLVFTITKVLISISFKNLSTVYRQTVLIFLATLEVH